MNIKFYAYNSILFSGASVISKQSDSILKIHIQKILEKLIERQKRQKVNFFIKICNFESPELSQDRIDVLLKLTTAFE